MKSGSGIYGLRLSILVLSTLLLSSTGCTGLFSGKMFKERAAETPPPNDEAVDKSFFVDPSGKPKTFMCAWAPEMPRGDWGEALLEPLINGSDHCNLEFEITKDYLVGKVIHPSFPNDRSRWREWLKIPITKHYYYEREKDSHGRETNRWIENDQRSDWTARPKMKLDLAGIHILDMGVPGWGGFRTTSVSEHEWDFERGFLGFSMEAVYSNPVYGSLSQYQAKFRVNFLRFEHDPTFKKIPYHQENSRHMNILHVMGRQVEGVQPELYAARWDLRKTQDLYLNGVPKELEKTVIAAVHKWNKTFQEFGLVPKGQLAFNPIVKNLKHPFDLRYPSINYITDRRISMSAPLGIGQASADVRNGKILWGSVTMFGGALEYYINAYTPGESAGVSASGSAGGQMISPFHTIANMIRPAMKPIGTPEQFNPAFRDNYARKISLDHMNGMKQELAKLDLFRKKATNEMGAAQADALTNQLKQQLASLQSGDANLNAIADDLLVQARNDVNRTQDYFAHRRVQDLLSSAGQKAALSAAQAAEASGDKQLAKLFSETDPKKREDFIKDIRRQSSPFFVEKEYTIENMAGSWMQSPARKSRTYPEMLESVIMHLALHELGHFMGLGHQFKENIVPEEGTVPKGWIKYLASRANAENEFSNYTSIMGYRSGRTEMMTPASELAPGPHDKLVLQYLYNGKYSSYDPEADDWVFTQVPDSGKIPEFSTVKNKAGQMAQLRTSYFPQCNDYEASLGADPFCNRWDRGSRAEDIVKSYFEHISDNLLANLYSLVGGGADPEYAEIRLWKLGLDSFSRVRMFYDEMRRRLRSEPHLKPLWNQLRKNVPAMKDFSTACMKANPAVEAEDQTLRDIFKDKSIVDLCRANAVALNEMRFFLNLPESDYPKIDHNNRFISGGYLEGDAVRNTGHIFGSWYQMSNLPLKYASLFSLTASTPFMMWGPYLVSNPYYANEENKYLYRTLYPREYTKLIAETVKNNMRFAVNGTDDTTSIGRAILATGGLLPWQRFESNDSGRIPQEFNDLLNQQTEFQFSMVAVMINATPPSAGSGTKANHYKKFSAKIYDFFTGKEAPAREVFILPKGQVLVWANNMFLYPVTKMKFWNDTAAYVIAYKVAYDYEEGDDLIQDSVKRALEEKHDQIAQTCVDGFEGTGLISYFDPKNTEFEGFNLPPGLASEVGKEKIGLFYKSIDDEFAKYEKNKAKIPAHYPMRTMRAVCDETLRGIGQISASASLINGYWLGITADYMEK